MRSINSTVDLSWSHVGIDLLTLSKPYSLILRCFFKSDLENKESIIMEDLNCDVSKLTPDTQTCLLLSLCSLYQLPQVINEPLPELLRRHLH